jgi:NADH-quinone oxidoreductase subunit E
VEDELLKILASYKGKRSKLIPILQEVQAKFSYLPEEMVHKVSTFTGIPESEVYSVATFYAQFRLTPLGRKRVSICRGTACHVRGAPQILEAIEKTLGIKEDETTSDLEYTLESVGCIGCCALAPCIRINEKVYGRLVPAKARELFTAPSTNQGGWDV